MSGTDLVAVETLKAADVFAPGGVEKLLTKVSADVHALNGFDATTEDGRAGIKSLAYKVARSKTALDDLGKEFVADLKKAAATVDADRRTIRDRLDALRDEVRKPVDDWERAEEKRVADHVAALDVLKAAGEFLTEPTIAEIDERLALVAIARAGKWEEFAERAGQLVEKVSATLAATRETVTRREAERAELERLRKAETERLEAESAAKLVQAQRERDQQIAHEAALAATRLAEEAIVKAEQEKLVAEARAEAAERQRKADAEKAEQDRVAATLQAARDQETAVAAERQRVADAKAAEDAATATREKDRSHRGKINKAAMIDLSNHGLSEPQARAVIVAIALGKISNVTIHY